MQLRVVQVKRRQKIRQTVLFVMFLLFPFLYYYLSPYLIIVAAAEGVISGSFIVFASMFTVSLFLGRAFCGWACPGAGEQELCAKISDKRFPGGKRDQIKYFIWAPWLTAIMFMFLRAEGIKSVNFLFHTRYGISIQDVGSVVLFVIIAGIVAALALLMGRRGFCHTLCWMAPFMVLGRKIRNIVRLPALALKAEKDRCVDCGRCAKACPMSLEVNQLVRHGSMENSECILCGTCADVCPEKVIRFSFGRPDRGTAGEPVS